MEDREYLIILYDYYGELLNDSQRKYFEEYYFDNLSLSEISENEDKSRNAIHKSIKSSSSKLYEYEEKLKLYEKKQRLDNIIDKFKGGPVGLEAISAAIGEEVMNLEDVCEPYLLQIGLLKRTARGRVVTDKAYNHLGIEK